MRDRFRVRSEGSAAVSTDGSQPETSWFVQLLHMCLLCGTCHIGHEVLDEIRKHF